MSCLSLNAPLMVEADGETDPLKVRDTISCHINTRFCKSDRGKGTEGQEDSVHHPALLARRKVVTTYSIYIGWDSCTVVTKIGAWTNSWDRINSDIDH